VVVLVGGLGGVVRVDWAGEEEMEQRREETHPYTKQPELLLHLDGMISRHVEAPVARLKQGLE